VPCDLALAAQIFFPNEWPGYDEVGQVGCTSLFQHGKM
jgi:hypothetical protein